MRAKGTIKTVKIGDITHKRLLEIGYMQETFDEVINRLIDFWQKNHEDWIRKKNG